MFSSLLGLNFRRKRLYANAPAGPLQDFYAVPFPAGGSDCRKLGFVALDLETTGLDPRNDEILSIGWVCINDMQIDLVTARHRLVCPHCEIPERSAVIHHITDDQAAEGEPLAAVLNELLPLLAGKVLIAHHARFEMQFLRRACLALFGMNFVMPVVDTQAIARRTLERRNQAFRPQELRLAALRRRHQLPRYRLHNALSDALAAAELFLAQLAQSDTDRPVPLNKFLLKV
ncbi:MAG TPA: exonuclease domain-containing protein [Gammaproteobacteria bacterium]|jgi:DNA polymerase-3 subunit epsilon